MGKLTHVATHFRGKVKDKIKPLVEKHYRFDKNPESEADNKAIYDRAKRFPYAFVSNVSRVLLLIAYLTKL